jgi:hypothetical protein
MEDARDKIEAASVLINMNRDPALAEFAVRAHGPDIPSKVRTFVKEFDKAVEKGVEQRFERVTGKRERGVISAGEFLSMAAECQSEDTPEPEKDKLIDEMVRALKAGRVR